MLQSREAEESDLLLVHSQEYIDEISDLHKLSLLELGDKEKTYDSVYLTPDTYQVSKLATGCLLQVFTFIFYFVKSCLVMNDEPN